MTILMENLLKCEHKPIYLFGLNFKLITILQKHEMASIYFIAIRGNVAFGILFRLPVMINDFIQQDRVP